MNLNKTDVLSAMQKTHDIIKEHPFRTGFGVRFIADYKNMLYTLSKDWCDYIYRCDHSPEEQSKLYQFGEWIHNFRQELRTYYKDTFPMQFFDYYEQMLQVTHIFLNTGNLDVYYNLDYFFPNGKNDSSRFCKSERYEYITKEKCGIDSPILPRYFGTQASLVTDDDAALEHINTCWAYRNKTDEERKEIFEKWKRETKPVIEWVNSRHEETEVKQSLWRSMIIAN